MPSYKRLYIRGGTYFFTVNLYDRRSTLLVEKIDLLRKAVRTVKQQRPFDILAWVVLPDHLHCLWSLPSQDADYSGRWRSIKTRFSKALRDADCRCRNESVWQKRFWEHTIVSERDFVNHLDYIHINPVKHGWVQKAVHWPYSSFHRYMRDGIYPPNWAGGELGLLDEAGGGEPLTRRAEEAAQRPSSAGKGT